MNKKPLLGVSACLLGKPVRFDGGHKRQRYITDTLADHFEFLPVCPEVEIGLGIPRPTIQLRQLPGSAEARLINPRMEDEDITEHMRAYCDKRVSDMEYLAGYILKKGSPSCGMEKVPVVVNEDGYRKRDGVGIFAQALMARWPLIPVEEEGRLNDPQIRENFFERVYALQNWRSIDNPLENVNAFIEFHASYKMLIMTRGSQYYKELGRLVAGTTSINLTDVRDAYIKRFMEVMSIRPSRGRQVNVLQHLLGYFKRELDSSDKHELLELFDRYRRQEVPLITPVTLLRHHLRRIPDPYLQKQHYFAPCPEQLALRSYLA